MTWSQIEPSPGQFNWSSTNTPLQYDYGLTITQGLARRYQVVMDSIPAWAAQNERVKKGPPRDWEAYRAFVKKLVEFTGDKVDVWDVMNEAMGSKWGGTLEELFMLHQVTVQAVKSVNPNARVIGPACGS